MPLSPPPDRRPDLARTAAPLPSFGDHRRLSVARGVGARPTSRAPSGSGSRPPDRGRRDPEPNQRAIPSLDPVSTRPIVSAAGRSDGRPGQPAPLTSTSSPTVADPPRGPAILAHLRGSDQSTANGPRLRRPRNVPRREQVPGRLSDRRVGACPGDKSDRRRERAFRALRASRWALPVVPPLGRSRSRHRGCAGLTVPAQLARWSYTPSSPRSGRASALARSSGSARDISGGFQSTRRTTSMPRARDEMLQVVGQAFDLFAALLLKAAHFDDLRNEHVIGLTDRLSGHVCRSRQMPIRHVSSDPRTMSRSHAVRRSKSSASSGERS
jgi:hypothetical protein